MILQIVKDGDDQVEAAYAGLAAELDSIHRRMTDDQLATVLDYLGEAKQAIERTTAAVRAGRATSRRPRRS